MALWGTGAGRQEGPAGEGQKVPEACTAVALLNRLLETPDPREGVTAQRRAQVTQGSQEAPDSLSVRGPGNTLAPWASIYSSVPCVGWTPIGPSFALGEGTGLGLPRKEASKLRQTKVKFFQIFLP